MEQFYEEKWLQGSKKRIVKGELDYFVCKFKDCKLKAIFVVCNSVIRITVRDADDAVMIRNFVDINEAKKIWKEIGNELITSMKLEQKGFIRH